MPKLSLAKVEYGLEDQREAAEYAREQARRYFPPIIKGMTEQELNQILVSIPDDKLAGLVPDNCDSDGIELMYLIYSHKFILTNLS